MHVCTSATAHHGRSDVVGNQMYLFWGSSSVQRSSTSSAPFRWSDLQTASCLVNFLPAIKTCCVPVAGHTRPATIYYYRSIAVFFSHWTARNVSRPAIFWGRRVRSGELHKNEHHPQLLLRVVKQVGRSSHVAKAGANVVGFAEINDAG